MRTHIFFASLLLFWSSIARCATTLYFNGKIITGADTIDSPADWLVLRGGRVLSSGKGKVPELPYETKVDLLGRFLLPSLTDAHAHIAETGREKFQIDLRGCESKEDVVSRIQAFVSARGIDKKTTILGANWDQSDWPGHLFPTHETLDKISKTQAIILSRVDGHAVWVNQYVLDKLGITKNTPDPKGGKIAIDDKGLPTGILTDDAMDLLQPITNEESGTQTERAILAAVEEAVSSGITGIHDAGSSDLEIETIRKLLHEKKLHFRFYEMLSGKDEALLKKYFKRGPEIDSENGQLTIRTVKLFADGAMGSRGAAFESPYTDDPLNRGTLILDEKELTERMTRIDKAGFQISVHAIGSLANHLTLNAMEKVLKKSIAAKRPRLEHAQVLDKADIDRIGRLGVIASMQPTHCTSDMKWVVDRIGKKGPATLTPGSLS